MQDLNHTWKLSANLHKGNSTQALKVVAIARNSKTDITLRTNIKFVIMLIHVTSSPILIVSETILCQGVLTGHTRGRKLSTGNVSLLNVDAMWPAHLKSAAVVSQLPLLWLGHFITAREEKPRPWATVRLSQTAKNENCKGQIWNVSLSLSPR